MADNDSRAGIRYASKDILDWCATTHVQHDGGLAAAFAAADGQVVPAIMVGPSEGKLLALLLKLAQARTVVEVGTLVGYSAIHMARALPAGGMVHSIEFDPNHAAIARQNIRAAGLEHMITVHEGPGVEVLPKLEVHGPFDAVFIDADKESYPSYGRWAAAHLRPGGLLLGDNAFLFGNLLDDSLRGNAMRQFHEEAREFFETVCIPTPDGLLLGIRSES